MTSRAKRDCKIYTGNLAGTFVKGQELWRDKYWQKWPNLFEHVPGTAKNSEETLRLLDLLDTYKYILIKNYEELTGIISEFKENYSVHPTDHPYVTQIRIHISPKEVTRLCHNYLSSVASLCDFRRIFCKKIPREDFDNEYQQKVDGLIDYECEQFLKQLRNYALHYQVVPLSHTLPSLNNEKQSHSKLMLLSKHLKESSFFRGAARGYLLKNEIIDVEQMISHYQKSAIILYDWMDLRTREMCCR